MQLQLDSQSDQIKQLMDDHGQLLTDHETVMKDQQLLLEQNEALKLARDQISSQHQCESSRNFKEQAELSQQLNDLKA